MKNKEKRKNDVQLVIVTNTGYVTRTSIEEFKTSHRSVKGVIGISAIKGVPVASCLTNDTSELFVLTEFGQIARICANEIRIKRRGTTGVKLVELDDDDSVVDIINMEGV